MGHESAGEIVGLGEGVEGWKIGKFFIVFDNGSSLTFKLRKLEIRGAKDVPMQEQANLRLLDCCLVAMLPLCSAKRMLYATSYIVHANPRTLTQPLTLVPAF